MNTTHIAQQQINEAIDLHHKWINGDRSGVRLDMSDCGLTGLNMAGASLKRAILNGANLNHARLDGAILVGARLNGASLQGASLEGARLSCASLEGATLEGALIN